MPYNAADCGGGTGLGNVSYLKAGALREGESGHDKKDNAFRQFYMYTYTYISSHIERKTHGQIRNKA